MKIKRIIFSLTALVLMMCACTSHNGDIGPYFGTWHVEKMAIDGDDDANYDDNLFFKFQGDVICMVVVNDAAHTRAEYWGTWSECDDKLTLNYTYGDDNTKPGYGRYAPPAASHLPGGITILDIIKLKGGKMQLRYVSNEDVTYNYYLKKW